MTKYYFRKEESILCHPIEYFIDWMRENGVNEMTIYRAEIERNSGYFFCKHHGEVGEKNNTTCGKKWCNHYASRNGVR